MQDLVLHQGEQDQSDCEHCQICYIGETIAQRDQSVSPLRTEGDGVDKGHIRNLHKGPTDVKDCWKYYVIGYLLRTFPLEVRIDEDSQEARQNNNCACNVPRGS